MARIISWHRHRTATCAPVAISEPRQAGKAVGPRPVQPVEKRYQTLRGSEGWHTDSSNIPLAAKASALSAEITPSKGGETELQDMRAAYDALDEDKKECIAGL